MDCIYRRKAQRTLLKCSSAKDWRVDRQATLHLLRLCFARASTRLRHTSFPIYYASLSALAFIRTDTRRSDLQPIVFCFLCDILSARGLTGRARRKTANVEVQMWGLRELREHKAHPVPIDRRRDRGGGYSHLSLMPHVFVGVIRHSR